MNDRINRINELIQQQLSQIIAQELELPNECLITITRVKTSPDIKNSKIFITVTFTVF